MIQDPGCRMIIEKAIKNNSQVSERFSLDMTQVYELQQKFTTMEKEGFGQVNLE